MGSSIAILLVVCSMPCLLLIPNSDAAATAPQLPVRAVNLGGWLVTEGWMKPSLFYGIPNNDTLDGTKIQFKSVTQKMYLSADQGGGAAILANRSDASSWETFRLWRINETTFNLRVIGGQFWGVNNTGALVATATQSATTPGQSEAFQLVRSDKDRSRVRIRAPNGFFLQVRPTTYITADYGQQSTNWSDTDPSVFVAKNLTYLYGEYQLCNGYGIANATQVLMNHWATFITERDFQFMASNGLNAVRIPVGWWIASGDNPPLPFVGGSVQFLDKAFSWGQKYNISVIVTLHAAPGSQNPYDHSATRDGSQEWGNTDANINQSVQVIDFLAKRYTNNTALLAIELLNEPLAPGVELDRLKKYYKQGYNTVRNYSSTTYVIMSNRLAILDQTELLQFAGDLNRTVLDVHYYNLFEDRLANLTSVEQNIDFVRNNRSSELKAITNQNGWPLTFVGEWSDAWAVPPQSANITDFQRFSKVQQDIYGNATFGWAYWTLQCVNPVWNMTYMIQNGVINLKS